MAQFLSRVRVGSFELNLQSGELRSPSGERVLLREQPFQVLRMLVERAGKIVTRAEIKETLWPNDTIVDFDHSINVAIGVLRKALGDSTASPRYIETLARRGYRLVAPVEWLETQAPAAAAGAVRETTPDPEADERPLGDLTGRKVGQYRVLEVLGGGGMGMVYKAEDLKLGRQVALKFLPEELARDPVALQRLEREAQTASALNHPNICTIYDIEEHEAQRFIAMELLEGETLQQRLAASAPNALPAAQLIDVAVQVCRGLEAAHTKAIVHRDIKPANIFLTKEGTAKILDFGIAKLVARADVRDPGGQAPAVRSSPQEGLTRGGVTVGTSGYMSPEQVRREDLDGRSDLFSLGLVLYEMATGRRAFTGDSAEVQDAILNATPPPPDALNRAVPRALSGVVGRALEKERARRYQTAAEMRLDLERVRGETRQRDRRGLLRWVAAAAAAALVVTAAALWLGRGGGVTLAPSDTIVIAHLTNATSDRVFDEALLTALRVALEQTPYLNVLADNKVRETLPDLGVDRGTRITPDVALQVCRKTGSRIMVAPSIADAGNRLRLEMKTIDCPSGSTVSQVANDAVSRDEVVAVLGDLALRLRRKLGEPSSSIAKYDAPLPEATSRSLEALELLTQGYRQNLDVGSHAAIPYYERAVLADPALALAHAALSSAYGNVGQSALSEAAGRKAFELRERLTAPARFSAESTYHAGVFGDLESACAVRARWAQSFPHDLVARTNLAHCLSVLGEPDRALGESREAARLLPASFTYRWWARRAMLADRLDETQGTIDDAIARGFDSPLLRGLRVELAFLRQDTAAMQEQWTWATGREGAENVLMSRGMVEASSGRFRDASRSLEAATVRDGTGTDPDDAIGVALMRAEAGLAPGLAIEVAPNDDLHTRLLATLALARMGRFEPARRSADALRRDFPRNTVVQGYGLPLIDGAVKLGTGEPAAAVELLKPSVKYDLAYTFFIPPLYPAYVRGLAYLKSGEPRAAAAEFQKVMRRPGLAGMGVIGPLSRLQLARAQADMGDVAAAMGSYEVFLNLWRNADSDVPVYTAAKAEYARLRHR